MQINSMNAMYSSASDLASAIAAAVKAPDAQNIKATSNQEKPAPLYDLHHMSIHELSDMIEAMYADGSMSADDTMKLSTEAFILERFSGYSADEKLDILNVVQEKIDMMKTQPQSTGIEYTESILNLLKGIDARLNAKIPSCV